MNDVVLVVGPDPRPNPIQVPDPRGPMLVRRRFGKAGRNREDSVITDADRGNRAGSKRRRFDNVTRTRLTAAVSQRAKT